MNGKLLEEIYMKQPPDFQVGIKVCKPKKSLYSLKQAEKAWNKANVLRLIASKCKHSQYDSYLYKNYNNEKRGHVLEYVDDIIITGVDND